MTSEMDGWVVILGLAMVNGIQMDDWVEIRWINVLVVSQRMTRIKHIKITTINELTLVPTTPIGRLGRKSEDIIVEEILRLYYVCKG
jgi:hypothetical protein